MGKKKNLILVIVLIIGFIISSIMLFNITNQKVKPVTVYKYAKDIDGTLADPEEKTITDSDILAVSIPSGAVDGNFALDKSEIVGKKVDCLVKSGTYVYLNQLSDESDNVFDELYSNVDISKLRTVTVAFELPYALAGNVVPGDRVDLVYCAKGKKVTDRSDSTDEDKNFVYTEPFMTDVWVYKVNTGDGFKYEDISDEVQSEGEGKAPLQYITFIGEEQKMIEIQNRSTAGKLAILGRLPESADYDLTGHVIGDYSKIFSGYVDVETGKMSIGGTEKKADSQN